MSIRFDALVKIRTRTGEIESQRDQFIGRGDYYSAQEVIIKLEIMLGAFYRKIMSIENTLIRSGPPPEGKEHARMRQYRFLDRCKEGLDERIRANQILGIMTY